MWWPDNFSEWITIVAGIATAVGIYLIWKQFGNTKKEMNNRLRPWISIEDITAKSYIFENGDIENFDDVQKRIVEKRMSSSPVKLVIGITIKNVGQMPAESFETRRKISDNKITRKEMKTAKIEGKGVLMPGQQDTDTYEISIEDFDCRKIQYVGFYVKYDVNGKNNYSGKIWKRSGNSREIIEDWIEK